jgi:HlyD family secretion protein
MSPRAVFVAAIVFASTSGAFAAGAAEPALPPGMAVTVTKIKKACFSDALEVVGPVVARNEILVRPDREGLQLSAIEVEAGDSVISGQVLARLDAPNDSHATVDIKAPSAGLVLAAPRVIGEMVSARGEPLFRIIANGDLDLSAEVPAKDVSRLAVGEAAKVKVAGIDESPAHVRLVDSTIDAVTQLGHVQIALDHNPNLRLGAFGRATVDVEDSCGLSIPLSALLFGPDGAVVQVIRDDRVETRRVTIGLFGQSSVEIKQGLAEGDMIVVEASAFLREGDRVWPVDGSQ